MKLKTIKNKKEYLAFLDWVDEMLDKDVDSRSAEGEKLQIALLLIKHYEDQYYPDLRNA